MSHDARVRTALHLLEALTATGGHALSIEQACAVLSCSPQELESYAELLSTLADREGGSRVIVSCDEAEVSLFGTAAELKPLRLSLEEGLALSHVIGALNLDEELSTRLSRALLREPLKREATRARIATSVSYGTSYQRLTEAIEDGVRCEIAYRSHDESSASGRIVDPYRIDTEENTAYLIAWNVEKDVERRYRLDRISSVSFTEDSVVSHAWNAAPVKESLMQGGVAAVVECSLEQATQLDWKGITKSETIPGTPDRVRLHVRVFAEHWLFDEVLASQGAMRIIAPHRLVTSFTAYAGALAIG